MKHILVAIALAALASAASPQDAQSSSTPTSQRQKPKAPPPAKVSPLTQKLRDFDTTKAGFMAALGACPRPEVCDPNSPERNPELVKMVKGREEAFVEACAQCASDAACEQERARIRAGRGRFGSNLCDPTVKPGTTPGSDKKPATTKPATDAKPAK